MSHPSLLGLAILASGLVLLSSGPSADAAFVGPVKSIPYRNVTNDGLQQVHFSHRYGWHCGMWEYYGHSHPDHCWRGRYGGPGYYGGGWRRHHYHDHDYDDRDRDRDRHHGDRDRDRDHKGDHDHD